MNKQNLPRIAIVTGASRLSGIGAAICLELAKQGIDILFTYWTDYDKQMPWGIEQDEPEQLLYHIRQLGVRSDKFEANLALRDSPSKIINEVEAKLGTPSILINNATYSTSSSYQDINADILDQHYQVNVRGTIMLCAEFARRFSAYSGGRIINITSGQGLGPMPGEIAYAATKGAIDAFTKTFAAEVASKGITVNAVNPGPTDTGWMTDELKANLLTRFPMGRIGLPTDAANIVAFLASPEAEWITGQIIHSEGGFLRGN